MAVRERVCPACATAVRMREARWCGSCGELLDPTPAAVPARTSPVRRRVIVGTAAVLAVGAVVLLGDGFVDRVGARTAAVQDVAIAAPDEEVLERVARRRTPRPRVETVTEPTCAKVADLSCFAWVARTEGRGFDTIAASDHLLITEETLAGNLVARDLRDGSIVWSVDIPRGFSDQVLRTIDDLLVHLEGGELVGRDLATGRERWRNDELGRFSPWSLQRAGDVLVAAGESHRATFEAGGPPNSAAAGIDPDTGTIRWQLEGKTASLAAGAVVVLVDTDGNLRAHEPTGELRWQIDEALDPYRGETAWVEGHVVTVYEATGPETSYRLSDGAPFELRVGTMTSDDDHTLVELYDVDSIGWITTGEVVLVGADGEVWRADSSTWGGCTDEAQLAAATVRLGTCDGGTVVLDRADGTELLRTPAPQDAATAFHRWPRVGPYEVSNADEQTESGDTIVTDLRHGGEVARLPPDTWPLWGPGPPEGPDLGGVMVLESPGWLIALWLPPPPGGYGTWPAQ